MLVYRLSKHKYSRDLEGIGAKLHAGRWNNKSTPCIYTAESRSLAILEYSSNVELDLLPGALDMTTYEIPEAEFLEIRMEELPGNWNVSPSPQSTKDFGSRLFLETNFLGIKIPSVIVPDEFNYLINPLSNKAAVIKVIAIRDFVFDVRIKL